ncbi:MAG: lipoprotein signal peptidase [Bacteroidales bacterium]|nr:lipoprotein signal peptidase [Bacteroidales bacterium]
MKISKGKRLIILGVVLVVIDQIIKVLVKTNMALGESIPVLGSWFQLLFVENEGMAFGMKFGGWVGKLLLTLFRIVLSGLLIWWISRLLKKEDTPTGVVVGLTLITAGALGNLVDCLAYGQIFSASGYYFEGPGAVAAFGGSYAPVMFGKVVDMFYFPLIDTTWPDWMPFIGGHPFKFFEPVFNFADSCVTCGAIYLILFQYKFFAREEGSADKKADK